MMFGICGRGLKPCNFWCILHLSFGCKVLKGEKQFSSSHCLPKCAAEDCGHTRSGVRGAAELTAWLTLARQLTACSLQTCVSCRNVNLPPKVINSWARVSPLLWPFPPETQSARSSPRESYPRHSFCLLSSHAALITPSASGDRSW